jgi:hypothetical protein
MENKNVYKKFCPNVFVAQCTEEHKKGDIIKVTTRHGKENACRVHNLVAKSENYFFYSITREDGYNNQVRAEKKVEKYKNAAEKALVRSDEWREKAEEGKDFLALGEPIKIGHHSEKAHRNLIERNHRRMRNCFAEKDKAEVYESKVNYWEKQAKKIDLSMPESLSHYKELLEKAEITHKGLKDGTIKRDHSLHLSYSSKYIRELKKKIEIANVLWG